MKLINTEAFLWMERCISKDDSSGFDAFKK